MGKGFLYMVIKNSDCVEKSEGRVEKIMGIGVNTAYKSGFSLGYESQELLTLGLKFSRVKMKFTRVKEH